MAKKTTTPKPTGARKPAARKQKPASKPAARKSDPARTPAQAKAATEKPAAKAAGKAAPARTVDRETFERAVRRAAYDLAKTRSFRNGSAFEDWVSAEKSVRERFAAEGVSVPRGKATASG